MVVKALSDGPGHNLAMSTASARRAFQGPALFSFGFRPFFLFGSAWAALSVPIWVHAYLSGSSVLVSRDWHVHEMLFGFLGAVIAGFLTTAIPNWTGRMPVIGGPLAVLVGLWGLGRLAMVEEGFIGPAAAVIDSAFLLAFAAVTWREVLAGRNWRNWPVCALVTALALGNVAFHVAGAWGHGDVGVRMALGSVTGLISLIGGRITPSFTRNWLRANRLDERKVDPRIDQASLGLTGLAMAAWVVAPTWQGTGVLLVGAGLLAALRLSRWSGLKTLSAPIVTILHVGFLWLALAQVLMGGSVLWTFIPRSAGIHTLTAGAIGVMTLAVMTRATRGHTGQALQADRATLAIYGAVNLAAVLRVAAPFLPAWTAPLLGASAALWFAAFGGFAIAYFPMLTRPRLLAARS